MTPFPVLRSAVFRVLEQIDHCRPPLLYVGAEIPGLLLDAFCCLTFSRAGSRPACRCAVMVVRGRGYGELPASRIDSLEKRWLACNSDHGFDLKPLRTFGAGQAGLAAGPESSAAHALLNVEYEVLLAGACRDGLFSFVGADRNGPMPRPKARRRCRRRTSCARTGGRMQVAVAAIQAATLARSWRHHG